MAGAFLTESSDVSLAAFDRRLDAEGVIATLDTEWKDYPDKQLSLHKEAVDATRIQWNVLAEDPTAQHLLRVASCFSQGTAIATATLCLLANVSEQTKLGHAAPLHRALKRLSRACLIEEASNDRICSHALVREFAAQQIPAETKAVISWQACAANIASRFRQDGDA